MKTKRDNKTKIPDIKAYVQASIKSEKLKPGFRLPSTVAYAEKLKADKMTVNKALTELEVEGVVYRVKGSGTFVADVSKPFIAKKGNIKIGVLMGAPIQPEIYQNQYWYGIIQGILQQFELENKTVTFSKADEKGFTFAKWSSTSSNVSVECIGSPLDYISKFPNLKVLDHKKFSGFIIVGITNEKWIRQVLALKKPVALVDYHEDRYHNECDMVTFDSAPAYKEAVAYLAELGLKRILFLGERHGVVDVATDLSQRQVDKIQKDSFFLDPDTLVRLYAYLYAMPQNGLCVKEDWIQFEQNNPKKFKAKAIEHCKLPKNQRPQAVICSYAGLAKAYIQGFAEHNLKMLGVGVTHILPDNKGLLVEDSTFLSIQSYPSEVGNKAAYLLAERIVKPRTSFTHISIPMKFIKPPVSEIN